MIQTMLKKITFYNFASYDIVENSSPNSWFSRTKQEKSFIIFYLFIFTLHNTHAFKQKLKENIATRVART